MARMVNVLARRVITVVPHRCGAMTMLRCPLGTTRSCCRVGMAVMDYGERHQQGEADGEPTRPAES